MFERFDVAARKAVVLAQDEARQLNHNYVGTEHLLLGVIRQDGISGKALEAFGVTLDKARDRVHSILGRGEGIDTDHAGPFTPRAKTVLQFALREALQIAHNHVGTELILLGLVRESEGVGGRALADLGVDAHKVRHAVVREIIGPERPHNQPHTRPHNRPLTGPHAGPSGQPEQPKDQHLAMMFELKSLRRELAMMRRELSALTSPGKAAG
jgi:ATP-dependent Clp protease ATP-binding subunit ClpC